MSMAVGKGSKPFALCVILALSAAPADQDRRAWRDYAGGPDSSRFSSSTQINKRNVSDLKIAWNYPHGETGFNPIVIHDVVFVRGRNNSLIALDARTGEEIWIHDGLQGMTERGVNYWESKDGKDRRLIFGVSDYLQEIDARTGLTIKSFGDNGVVDLKIGLGRDPATVNRGSSGTPGRIFENLILLGSAPGEGYLSPPGDLRAYDVLTGRLVWTFHTIPRPGEYGYDTWPPDAYKYAGGANTWGEISLDTTRGIAYFPTGSPTYDFYGADRVGANLFGNSLIALDARTGRRLWHFQAVHHDLWDYDSASAPQLTTIRRNGRRVDVVAMANKAGFLYVFNRVTGQPVWPIVERPVPTRTEVPGEVVFPTQPFPTSPPPFALQRFTADDVAADLLTPEEQNQYRDRIAKARNEGLFTPIGFTDTIHMPGNQGGSNWGGTAANPNDGTVYVVGFNIPSMLRLLRPEETARSGRGAIGAAGAGSAVYERECQNCHGAGRAGTPDAPSLVGAGARLTAASLRSVIVNGGGEMPSFRQLSGADLDAVIQFLTAADNAAGPRAGARGARGAPPLVFPPGPIVASGPAATRPASAGRASAAGNSYPEGVRAPATRYTINGFGTIPSVIKPPYTTLTAYDLNRGVIKWQVGLGDDLRLRAKGITGTGTALQMKTGVIPTATGLVFVTSGDNKLRALDADNGRELWSTSLGAPTQGSPAMYEIDGRQYIVVSASDVGLRYGRLPGAPATTGPTGYVAFALPSTRAIRAAR